MNECKLIASMAGSLLARAGGRTTMRSLMLYLIAAVLVSTAMAVSAQAPAPRKADHPAAPGITGNVTRGQYIVEHVAMCVECHSPRDEEGRIIQGHEFMGAPLPIKGPSGWATRAPRNRGLLGYN